MDRYVLLVAWDRSADPHKNEEFTERTAATGIYDFLRKISNTSINSNGISLPACSVTGVPVQQKWFFAIQTIYGFSQFCSSEWEDIGSTAQGNDSEELLPNSIQDCLNGLNNYEEEDDFIYSNLLLYRLFEEAAEGLHQLADKLPPPGRGLLDLILLVSGGGVPRLKDWLPVVGAFKHLREWHSAEIAIATKDGKCWQKIAEYLGATVVDPEKLEKVIDPMVIWRGTVQIRERKFTSEVKFPGFCLKADVQKSWRHLIDFHTLVPKTDSTVFYYYKPEMNFVQLLVLSDLPSYFFSGTEFELNDVQGKSKLLLNQLSSLQGKVGALFNLSCTVSSTPVPSANQYSTRKWKEYMAKKPRSIGVPDVEIKGEDCSYYLLIQGNGRGGCKGTLMHSANQINGAAAVAVVHAMLDKRAGDGEGFDIGNILEAMPCFTGEQLVNREKKLTQLQTLALKEFLSKYIEWTGIVSSSSETLLGLKDVQRIPPVHLDAKELLKYFTAEGIPTADLQPLQIQRGENEFPLTPRMTLNKLKNLPFEKAAECHYHGLEYCLDNRRALEKDIAFGKLQSRLIRYETNTTCSRECSPVIYGLSPLPSPAVLSEPGSVPDDETLQSEQKTADGSGQKRRSRALDGLHPSKRLIKSESTDSLNSQYSLCMSQGSGSSGHHSAGALRERLGRLSATTSTSKQSKSQAQKVVTEPGHKNVKQKESRSQKHIRMLKEVVAKTLEDNGVSEDHKCFDICSQRLFEISKLYLKVSALFQHLFT
uniref:MDM2 binding protein n=1 Tax=Callorhinchus milii TaxID=7868 RepID=A0A4W3I9T6_CALMI